MIINNLGSANNPYIAINIEPEDNEKKSIIKSSLKKVNNQQSEIGKTQNKRNIRFANESDKKIYEYETEFSNLLSDQDIFCYVKKYLSPISIERATRKQICSIINEYIKNEQRPKETENKQGDKNTKLLLSIINDKKDIPQQQIMDCITEYIDKNYDNFKTKLLNNCTSQDNDISKKEAILQKDPKHVKEKLIKEFEEYVCKIRMKPAEKRNIVAINIQAMSILKKI